MDISPVIPHSKLFVFRILNDAKFFRDCYAKSNQIYECEIKNKYQSLISATITNILTMWKLRYNKKKFSHLARKAPKGTILTDAVKLLRKVS
ncbi:hypothetical protein LCGC14_1498710 [marine sediment metagenome]|uniref:Uncharacterized protein n=1 Tax=marine sediment metagenome TaxID=412755 RepID=A0A0F9LKD8_9ZZZZ